MLLFLAMLLLRLWMESKLWVEKWVGWDGWRCENEPAPKVHSNFL